MNSKNNDIFQTRSNLFVNNNEKNYNVEIKKQRRNSKEHRKSTTLFTSWKERKFNKRQRKLSW